jgi:hypothetical protein
MGLTALSGVNQALIGLNIVYIIYAHKLCMIDTDN